LRGLERERRKTEGESGAESDGWAEERREFPCGRGTKTQLPHNEDAVEGTTRAATVVNFPHFEDVVSFEIKYYGGL
jgi:hypothetical protein